VRSKSMNSCKRKLIKSILHCRRYKHSKVDFDKRISKIFARIKHIREEVVVLNKLVNKRNGNIVKEIAEQIDQMISKI
jgi:hypothetical protein